MATIKAPTASGGTPPASPPRRSRGSTTSATARRAMRTRKPDPAKRGHRRSSTWRLRVTDRDDASTTSDSQRRRWLLLCAAEFVPRADVEPPEDLVQVVLDGTRADEQASGDLGVGEAVSGEPRDLGLLGGEVFLGLDDAFANTPASGLQLPLGAPRERLETH